MTPSAYSFMGSTTSNKGVSPIKLQVVVIAPKV